MWTRQAIRKFVRDAAAQAVGQALFLGLILIVSVVVGIGFVVWRRAGDGPSAGDIAIVLVVILSAATLAAQWKPNRPKRNERDSKPVRVSPPVSPSFAQDKTTRTGSEEVDVSLRAEAIALDWYTFAEEFRKGVEVGVAGPMGGPALASVTVRAKRKPMEAVVLRVSGPRLRGVRIVKEKDWRNPLASLAPGTTETQLELGNLSRNRPVEILLLIDVSGFERMVEFDWFLDSGNLRLLSDTFRQRLE